MARYRSILALILAALMTFLVSCSSPAATKSSTTYSAAKIEQIQQIATTLSGMRETLPLLGRKIQQRNWTDVRTYIHGPLGDLRRNTSYLTRELLPQDQKVAIAVSKDLFDRLQSIDLAAENGNYQKALENYAAAVKDFDDLLRLVPEKSTPA